VQTALFSFSFSSFWFAGVNQCKPSEVKETPGFIEVRTSSFHRREKNLLVLMTAVLACLQALGNNPHTPCPQLFEFQQFKALAKTMT